MSFFISVRIASLLSLLLLQFQCRLGSNILIACAGRVRTLVKKKKNKTAKMSATNQNTGAPTASSSTPTSAASSSLLSTSALEWRGRLPPFQAQLLSRALIEAFRDQPLPLAADSPTTLLTANSSSSPLATAFSTPLPTPSNAVRRVEAKLGHILFSSIEELCDKYLNTFVTIVRGENDVEKESKFNQELRRYGEQPVCEKKLRKLYDLLFYHRLTRRFFPGYRVRRDSGSIGDVEQQTEQNGAVKAARRAETPESTQLQTAPASTGALMLPPPANKHRGPLSSSGCSSSSSLGTGTSAAGEQEDAGPDGVTTAPATRSAAQQLSETEKMTDGPLTRTASASKQNIDHLPALPILFTAPHSIPLQRDGEKMHHPENWTSSLANSLAQTCLGASLAWSNTEQKRIKALSVPTDPSLRDPNYLHLDELEGNYWYLGIKDMLEDMKKVEQEQTAKAKDTEDLPGGGASSRTIPEVPFTLHVDVHGCMNPNKPPHYYTKEVFFGFGAMELPDEKEISHHRSKAYQETKEILAEQFRKILKRRLDVVFQTFYAPGSIIEDRPTVRLTGKAKEENRFTLTQQSQRIGFDVSVQLELSHGLRKQLSTDLDFKREFCFVFRKSYTEMAEKMFGAGAVTEEKERSSKGACSTSGAATSSCQSNSCSNISNLKYQYVTDRETTGTIASTRSCTTTESCSSSNL
ncbi:unnamed protein product [Amoebophrya sp. A120]|nr:unnamed protein product [Amoebophrya sp. A120]|eukprot:GSA120T00010291001.1